LLLVDDNRGFHQLFKRYLSGLPVRVLSAYHAPGGLALARSEKPDVVVLDIMMPDQDGWELLANLQAEATTRDLPIVICSVLSQEALARSLAVAGYLRKPVTQAALLSTLRSLDLGDFG
jgi:CheY-like chemotaxis protein